MAALLLLTACTPTPSTPTPTPTPAPTAAPVPASPLPARARAEAAAQALQSQLKGALTAAMTSGGPIAAIDVCANSAPAIASALSVDGVTVARTSSRLRNSANAAPTWVSEQVTTWEKQPPAERKPYFVEAAGVLPARYAAPLPMLPLCATCHGESVADDVKRAIAARYPNDQATGFAANDLRGAVWVELSR